LSPDGACPEQKVSVQQDEINVRDRENKIRDEQGVTPAPARILSCGAKSIDREQKQETSPTGEVFLCFILW